MQLLLEITEKNLGFGSSESFTRPYQLRKAARAVIFNASNQIALLAVTKLNYYKLPGGGVEAGENLTQALAREVLEETGSTIQVEDEIGVIIEYRDRFKILQISYCYRAHLIGQPRDPHFTAEEKANGFELLWLPLPTAIQKLAEDRTTDYEGKFIEKRDLAFLQKFAK